MRNDTHMQIVLLDHYWSIPTSHFVCVLHTVELAAEAQQIQEYKKKITVVVGPDSTDMIPTWK